jgi:hypothetical protein
LWTGKKCNFPAAQILFVFQARRVPPLHRCVSPLLKSKLVEVPIIKRRGAGENPPGTIFGSKNALIVPHNPVVSWLIILIFSSPLP